MPTVPYLELSKLASRLMEEKLDRLAVAQATITPDIEWALITPGAEYAYPPAMKQFRIASMTKSFTAATVLSVLDEHHSVDTRLGEVVPEIHSSAVAEATVEQALSMTAGLPTDDAWADRLESLPHDEFLRLLGEPLITNQPPGMNYEYSNLGYAIVGLVAERLGKAPFPELMTQHILKPLSLEDTSFRGNTSTDGVTPVDGHHVSPVTNLTKRISPTEPGMFSPIGGLWSTTADLSRWVTELRDSRHNAVHGLPQPTKLHEILAKIQNPISFFRLESTPSSIATHSYGYGLHHRWEQDLGEFLFHTGGYPGFGSHMQWHTETGVGLVMLGNSTYFPAEDVVRPVLHELISTTGYRTTAPREKAARLTAFPSDHPEPQRNADSLLKLISQWDDEEANQVLSANMLQDYESQDLKLLLSQLNQAQLVPDCWLSRTEWRLTPGKQVPVGSRDTPWEALHVLFNPFGKVQKFLFRP